MYHRIAPEAPGPLAHLTMPPDRFAWQMTALRDGGFALLRQSDVAAWVGGRRDLPPRAMVVTFDDAYADNVVHAFPVLERLGIPAVTFVVTDKLGGRNDWDSGVAPWPIMDAASVRDWSARGLEFGGHGRTHRSLAGLGDGELVDEIVSCRDTLRALTGERPLAFAYPYGNVDPRAREQVSRHFAVGYGATPGRNRRGADPWTLRRTAVLPAYPDYEFRWQTRLGWGPRDALFRARRGFKGWLAPA
jgi:peptidoglycan/xylan/chitin deacetylase (PgdA/CDA1 family)